MALREIVREEPSETNSTPSPDAAVEVTGKLRCGSFNMGIRIYMSQSPHCVIFPVHPSDIHPNATRSIIGEHGIVLLVSPVMPFARGIHSPESQPVLSSSI